MKLPLSSLLLVLSTGATPVMLHAADAFFPFDSVPSGSPANLAAHPGISFEPAVFLPLLDGEGVPVAGTEAWRVDGSAGAVTVENPLTYDRGVAPSGPNALNAVFQPVLIDLASPTVIRQFAMSLDADTLGDRAAVVTFWDSGDKLLGSFTVNQRTPLLEVNEALELSGVAKVVLPAGAFYDNLRISSIPEPGPVLLVLVGSLCLGISRRAPKRREAR
ncbi:MAG: hypothetical protein IT580_09350 [Verrucomicrobiales bacterium]|nr:hypothetical protein [Verrucomicrobiales bacterium]